MSEKESKPRIISWSSNGEMAIRGISKEDQEKVTASFEAGAYWIRVKDGKLEIKPSWKELPDPVRDPVMFPFWREPMKDEVKVQTKLFEIEPFNDHSSPSILISSLCAYNYSAENYKFFAERLESYGFDCMRSRRGHDGKYWEIWYLCGLWASEGDLKEAIGQEKGLEALKLAKSFLAKNVLFGTLDVSVQRMATVLSD